MLGIQDQLPASTLMSLFVACFRLSRAIVGATMFPLQSINSC